jgi:hypothetical protein
MEQCIGVGIGGQEIARALDIAERKAWDSLSRYKFWMFGYHAAQWVLLNSLCYPKARNPFAALVKMAKEHEK